MIDLLLCICLVSSIKERILRASLIFVAMLVVNTVYWLALMLYNGSQLAGVFTVVSLVGVVVFAVVSLVKRFPEPVTVNLDNIEQYDERDNMFARNNLKHHLDLAKEYYDAHPEAAEIDRAIHAKTELGEPGSRFYDQYLTPIASAAFAHLGRSRHLSKGPVADDKTELDVHKFAAILKRIAMIYGAVDVGICKLGKHHVYSNAGRHAENYGEPIETSHTTAIAIIVPMDPAVMRSSPTAPELVETSRAYVESAKIAHIIAEYIRSFGYDARPHTDGNYEVLCVPVAAEAGLGEVGRMGLLIHPVYGPCVRISMVTTEIDLPTDSPVDRHIEDFCRICSKCADLCPSQSISKEWKNKSRGFDHFSIRQETCYSYWKDIGTDCGFCIRVCPYTKPNTLFHKLIRFYVSRNCINQKIALVMENIFYGKRIRPAAKTPVQL